MELAAGEGRDSHRIQLGLDLIQVLPKQKGMDKLEPLTWTTAQAPCSPKVLDMLQST